MGREVGMVPDQASRDKAMNSNPTRSEVITPRGYFVSYKDAARAYGVTSPCIKYYCVQGEKQRSGQLEVMGRNNVPDYRGWMVTTPQRKPNTQPVRTPKGDFPTLKAAADFYGITSAAVIHRLNKKGQTEWLRLEQE